MSAEKSDHNYKYKTDFQILRENQEFERQNILISRPPLDSTPIDTKHEKRKNVTFGIDSYWYKNARPQSTNTTNRIIKSKGWDPVPEDTESDPALSDSSSSKYDSSYDSKYSKSRSKNKYGSDDDRKYSKSKIKKRDKNKNHR